MGGSTVIIFCNSKSEVIYLKKENILRILTRVKTLGATFILAKVQNTKV